MRRKFRIFSTLTAMVLVLIVMCVGIWAATQITIQGSGNVSFVAKDVMAKVSIFVDDSDSPFYEKTFNQDSEGLDNIGMPNFEFENSEAGKSHTLKVKIENMYESSISINAYVGCAVPDPYTDDFTISILDSTSNNIYTISNGQNKEITVTITYNGDYKSDINCAYNLLIQLTR